MGNAMAHSQLRYISACIDGTKPCQSSGIAKDAENMHSPFPAMHIAPIESKHSFRTENGFISLHWQPLQSAGHCDSATVRSTRSQARPDQTQAGGWALEKPDRKSTRLNSSHSQISYAVFCLKKKKKIKKKHSHH